ncbi:hypothetical protein B0H13DRAFT_1935683 [Mycena leptocephala]|nr:hypothetical protein B0H13DRAFT_1935683 [Mycena leptocephala]
MHPLRSLPTAATVVLADVSGAIELAGAIAPRLALEVEPDTDADADAANTDGEGLWAGELGKERLWVGVEVGCGKVCEEGREEGRMGSEEARNWDGTYTVHHSEAISTATHKQQYNFHQSTNYLFFKGGIHRMTTHICHPDSEVGGVGGGPDTISAARSTSAADEGGAKTRCRCQRCTKNGEGFKEEGWRHELAREHRH